MSKTFLEKVNRYIILAIIPVVFHSHNVRENVPVRFPNKLINVDDLEQLIKIKFEREHIPYARLDLCPEKCPELADVLDNSALFQQAYITGDKIDLPLQLGPRISALLSPQFFEITIAGPDAFASLFSARRIIHTTLH
jgi:hypothetical protein